MVRYDLDCYHLVISSELQTHAAMQPPKTGMPVAVGFEGDDIEEIGDKIAALKPPEADQLRRYLELKITREETAQS